MAKPGKLVNIDLDAIVSSVADGANIATIAASLGCNPSSLHRKLVDHPDYQTAKFVGTAVRLDQAEIELRNACDMSAISRAREIWRAVSWRAEREHPAHWGRTDKLQVENITDLGDRLRRAKERVIEHDAPQQSQPALTYNVDNASQVVDK